MSREVGNHDSPGLRHVSIPGAGQLLQVEGKCVVTPIWPLGYRDILSTRDEKKDMLNHIKVRMPVICFFGLKIMLTIYCNHFIPNNTWAILCLEKMIKTWTLSLGFQELLEIWD